MERLATAVLSFLALFAVGAASAVVSCPSDEDLAPCTCKRLDSGLQVVCANFRDKSYLPRAFKLLDNYQLQYLLLSGLNISDALPNDLFDGLEVAELKVQNSYLKFSQPAFTGLEESLKTLRVLRSTVDSPEEDPLAKLVKLEELIVEEVPIGKVTDDTFNGKIPNVRTLILDDNEITDVSSKAFGELQYLTKFSASGNGIKTVARTMGPRPALYLESVDFSNNEISVLPDDSFAEIPNLKTLIFSGNNLKTVSKAAWSGVWEQLDTALLFENDLVCDEEMDWLREKKWPRVVTGHCVLPSHLVGKSLREVYKPKE